jgi:hypothetical protein
MNPFDVVPIGATGDTVVAEIDGLGRQRRNVKDTL